MESLEVDDAELDRINHAIASVAQRMATLRNLRSQGDLRRAIEARLTIDGLEVDLSDVRRRRDRAAERVVGQDGSEATNTQKSLQDALEARGVAKEALTKLRNDLNEARIEHQRVKAQIPSDGQSELIDLARAKNQLADHLRQLFAASVGEFRDELRRKVEQRSAEMFLALTSEPDYAGLRINEDYGLEILRRDGSPVTIRSAGAEHIVAYSLISALQSSSPRPGPVIVDSPFGRLDHVHSHNVVVALPKFSEQVVLLVHENELDLDDTRRLLGTSLLKEFRLERRSSSHTVIVEA
jgi:DNA sulfur modification protein DndD